MIHEFIRKRRSPFMFSEAMISEKKLLDLFEAARWAPSSNNQQPWRYIIATRDRQEDYLRLFGCLNKGNRLWAGSAPVLGVSISESVSDYNFRENRYARHDVGLSTATLIFQGMSVGIYVHVMGGFNAEKATEVLQIPDRFDPVAMLAIGYPAADKGRFAPELLLKENRTRNRRDINELLFFGSWGKVLNDRDD